MSLYDDLDVKARATEKVSGWSSGIKLLQSQLQLKKATVTQPKREQQRKVSLAPVIDLKSKRDDDDIYPTYQKVKNEPSLPTLSSSVTYGIEYDWNVDDEYDPLWPNEFDKVVKELRENRERENDKEEKRRERKRKSRFSDPEESLVIPTPQITQPPLASGFAGRWAEEDDEIEPVQAKPRASGVAIAPPPSLQEPAESAPIFPNKPPTPAANFGSSVAAKIMAKYGFKEGQGLGKQEQGMASALQVEKTSKRGGRIIHEKEIMAAATASPVLETPANTQQQSITEIIKNPSKVVLLKNMVGPGEVDDDLEPEVKDECNTKYGEVTSVIIHETQAENPEEAVRIFVEFRRIESAIKAVVDLNGRFFGGRQVKASFYDTEKFDNLQLMD
ncbi:splicing factor 45 [Tribolium castaneum]|uniref:Splicing factor 45 n=1 Tax=Tribolium castaneum TaxID=7070 RepID=D6WJ68_TRICA|nr:PREDICTED: splicing factor 45 [Tribolium castaneum]EFA03164.1 Splicing factor 45-like Protein [Tribolium castaneum]|eukprot:XP_975149.1 PREDICTED: splicing factor 45 [Tribolium castaneum]